MSAVKSSLIIFFIMELSAANATAHIKPPTPIFNQAYQENYQADALQNILANAHNAYILLDPLQNNIAKQVAALKANNNQVAAYISIGTGEEWRPDFAALTPYLTQKPWGEWPGEYFISQINPQLVSIMQARIDRLENWGFDWVEFDNMDWLYDDDNRKTYNLRATIAQSIEYAHNLCAYVHQKGMKCMAKNHVQNSQIFDGVLYESYSDEKNWWNVTAAQKFYQTGKLFIINHYNELHCDKIYTEYKQIYGKSVSFICEDLKLKAYRHFNLRP
ncbi:MAG: endo alpha-1,4 polygalactosaminidase [Rhizobiales bacterium]|nr:endo alpha-1,4 polygalactosaminidase [Hyphomicrobiales bacterium]NRB15554.1 endo alpha-1,4 polygalactosaminidase [Hyphomicrobiales bacterium]